jgi:hypothetical protein
VLHQPVHQPGLFSFCLWFDRHGEPGFSHKASSREGIEGIEGTEGTCSL